ncbi:MAG: molybdopterin synthase sulfur carrier subunit [Halioglobus sp.]|nr:molybdopterin synthase sulfur carrier subunit [Halioglobus sp.]
MIEVLFFAQVRERLDCASLSLAFPATGLDLDGLQARLIAEHGPGWAEVLGQDNIIRAVNQVVAERNTPLNDGDEVAFYPPVTGG